jgi:hypothetical protein
MHAAVIRIRNESRSGRSKNMFQDPDHCGMKFVSGKLFLTSRKNDLGCSFRIPDPDPDIFPSPDYPVTGSGSATLGIGHLHNLSSRSDLDFKFLTYS